MPSDLPPPPGLAVHRDPVPRAPAVRPVPESPEALVDPRVLGEAPVVEEEHFVAVDDRGFGLLDDERAVEPPGHLLPCALVRVVPEGPGVRRREVVQEVVAWLDHLLGELGHSVHLVLEPDAVPVHGRGLGEIVHQPPGDLRTLRHADRRPWNAPVVSPDGGLGVAGRGEARGARHRVEHRGRMVSRTCREGPRAGASANGEHRPARKEVSSCMAHVLTVAQAVMAASPGSARARFVLPPPAIVRRLASSRKNLALHAGCGLNRASFMRNNPPGSSSEPLGTGDSCILSHPSRSGVSPT